MRLGTFVAGCLLLASISESGATDWREQFLPSGGACRFWITPNISVQVCAANPQGPNFGIKKTIKVGVGSSMIRIEEPGSTVGIDLGDPTFHESQRVARAKAEEIANYMRKKDLRGYVEPVIVSTEDWRLEPRNEAREASRTIKTGGPYVYCAHQVERVSANPNRRTYRIEPRDRSIIVHYNVPFVGSYIGPVRDNTRSWLFLKIKVVSAIYKEDCPPGFESTDDTQWESSAAISGPALNTLFANCMCEGSGGITALFYSKPIGLSPDAVGTGRRITVTASACDFISACEGGNQIWGTRSFSVKETTESIGLPYYKYRIDGY